MHGRRVPMRMFAIVAAATIAFGTVATVASAAPARPAIAIGSITPSSVAIDTPHASLGIIGKGFVDGMTAKVRGTGVVATSLDFYDAHVIRVGVRVAADAHPGPRTLLLTTPTGHTFRCLKCILIVRQPTATDAFPATIGQGARANQGAAFIVHGSGFDRFVGASIGDGVNVYSSGSADSKTMFAYVNVAPGAPLGTRDVTIVNFNYGHTVCVACITIDAAPIFGSLAPNSLAPGDAHVTLTLTGTGFQPYMAVRFSQIGVHIESVHVDSDTSATVTVSVSALAHPDSSTIVLTNTDHGTSKAIGVLSVS